MSKKTTRKTTKTTTKKLPPLRVIDENTSARVIAEYLSVGKVTSEEIDRIMDVPHGLSPREIALMFRISDVTGVSDPFKISPRFRLAFERARLVVCAEQPAALTEERAA